MAEVNKKIAKTEKQKEKELSKGEEGMYPGSPLKGKERHVPRSIPKVHDTENKRKAEEENAKPMEKAGKTERSREKLKVKLPDYRPSMVRTKKTPSFRNEEEELPTGRGWGTFGPHQGRGVRTRGGGRGGTPDIGNLFATLRATETPSTD